MPCQRYWMGASCNENTWTATAAPPEARDSHTAVWTGSEMIIWGGRSNNSVLDSGGRYDPATDTWTFTNTSGAPSCAGEPHCDMDRNRNDRLGW